METADNPLQEHLDDTAGGLTVDRPRLLALDRGQPVLVAEAPSGYGKTVFARAWLRAAPTGCDARWLSLDRGARDPAVFLDRLALTVEGRGLDEAAASLDEGADQAARFAQLAARLAQRPRPLRLVLDDAHHLADSPSRRYLQRLLLGANARLRICLTLQPVALEAGLGEATAQGRVAWIDASGLALRRDEIASLAAARGYQLADSQLDALQRSTTGWPALVQMALALPPTQTALELGQLAGLGPVREYIYERFLTRLDTQDREVLWPLACLGSAPVRLLRTLAHNIDRALARLHNLGVVQAEEPAAEPSLRLHPLVRESALRVLAEHGPTDPATVLASAAEWYWQQGMAAASVRASIEAGGAQLAIARERLLPLGRELVFHLGQHQTWLELVAQWEHAAGTHDAALDSLSTWALTFQRRFGAGGERLERSLIGQAPPDAAHEAQLQRALIAALQDDYQQGGRLAAAWLQTRPAGHSFYVGAAQTIYAYRLKCEGEIPAALSALRDAHITFDQVQSVYGIVWVCVVAALTHVRLGQYRDALAEIEQGLRSCGEPTAFAGQRAMLRAVEAFIRYERDELPAVRDALDQALPLLHEQGLVETLVLGYTAAARLRAAGGEIGPALDLLSEAERAGQARQFPRLTQGLRAERALILARNGAWGQARHTAESTQLDLDPDSFDAPERRDRATRLRVRFDLSDGDTERARSRLLPALEQARQARQLYKQCELLVLLAQTEDMAGRETEAFAALRDALALASAQTYRRVLIDEGSELHGLMRRWLRSAPPSNARPAIEWAEALLAAVDRASTPPTAASGGLIEPLNARERQCLSMIAEGLTNAEIAARCFVVEGTVKWHLHNVYGKLGVRSRTAALRAARSLGLLPG